MAHLDRFWAFDLGQLAAALGTGPAGLSVAEAASRLRRAGAGSLTEGRRFPLWVRVLAARFANPLVVILLVAALVSMLVREWVDAWIVLGIVVMTAVLSFVQEFKAQRAVAALRQRVTLTSRVLRDGELRTVPNAEVVPGDVIELSAGTMVPADGRILDARSCHINQSALTGEMLPVEKQPGVCPADATLEQRSNSVYLGTSVRSGWARMVAVDTGDDTVYADIARRLRARMPKTEFERGLRRFGTVLLVLMLTVVLVVLAANIVLHRPTVETLLFAAALAVGLSPELLPAILTITLAHGARAMAARGVIVKRLDAIENLGSMDVLCTDKTGTLTRGSVELSRALDLDAEPSPEVLRMGWLNASLQAGIQNPLDDAILARGASEGVVLGGTQRIDEIPYDFANRRLGIVVQEQGLRRLVTKGAVDNVLAVCARAGAEGREVALDATLRARVREQFEAWSNQGYRVLAVAWRSVPAQPRYAREDERDMVLAGFLLFFDPPEPGVAHTLDALRRLGVAVKIITGDNRFVAGHVADAIGMQVEHTLTGAEMQALDGAALRQVVSRTTLFTEIDPGQKERIIVALQRAGHVVGYLGDGINDAPALHAADVGVSVDQAVDVAKDAADFVLLRHSLDVLQQGIEEGRRTFANTLKYIFITISANFGNMISMALASVLLPFLPLLAQQILLNNFLSDIPAMGIAGDNVDAEWQRTPHRWDMRLILRAMLVFGLTSTLFDLLTFWTLLSISGGTPQLFRTGWFVESLLTEVCIVLVIRTARPLHRSRPGRFLAWSVPFVALAALGLPYTTLGTWLGFVPLPPGVVALILVICLGYVAASEATKGLFYRRLRA